MKNLVSITILLFLGILFTACAEREIELTRVDVYFKKEDGNFENEIIISEQEKIDVIKEILGYVKWEPNTKAEIARHEDVMLTLFFTFDKNLPERLYVHRIWFNGDGSATIISDNEKEGYGVLIKEKAEELKQVIYPFSENEASTRENELNEGDLYNIGYWKPKRVGGCCF